MPSYVTDSSLVVKLGERRVEGRLIVCPFIPEQIAGPAQLKLAYKKVVEGVALSKELGLGVVALGGFTSILDRISGNTLCSSSALSVTPGSLLTASLAIEQLRKVLSRIGRSLETEAVAIVGATGDVGGVCANLLDGAVRKMFLIARRKRQLEDVRSQLSKTQLVEISTNVRAALNARVVITATSASQPLFETSEFAAGTVICDVGYPKTLRNDDQRRYDILVFSGGLAQLPHPLGIQEYTDLPADDVLFGCFTEGIVRAATCGQIESKGETSAEQAANLLSTAISLGIRPAPAYRGNRLLQEKEYSYVQQSWV
jgi:predicted amino acid dehydrogenase